MLGGGKVKKFEKKSMWGGQNLCFLPYDAKWNSPKDYTSYIASLSVNKDDTPYNVVLSA